MQDSTSSHAKSTSPVAIIHVDGDKRRAGACANETLLSGAPAWPNKGRIGLVWHYKNPPRLFRPSTFKKPSQPRIPTMLSQSLTRDGRRRAIICSTPIQRNKVPRTFTAMRVSVGSVERPHEPSTTFANLDVQPCKVVWEPWG